MNYIEVKAEEGLTSSEISFPFIIFFYLLSLQSSLKKPFSKTISALLRILMIDPNSIVVMEFQCN